MMVAIDKYVYKYALGSFFPEHNISSPAILDQWFCKLPGYN